MGLNQIPQQENSSAYPSPWFYFKTQLSLARPLPLDILNIYPCLGHSLIMVFLTPMPFIWCPHRGLHAPSQRRIFSTVTFLSPSLVVWPAWEKGTHAESPQLSGSMKSPLWFLLDIFLNHLCRVLNHRGIYVCGKCYALIPLNIEVTWLYLPCCCNYNFITLRQNSSPELTFQPYWLCKVHSGFVSLPLSFSRGSYCKEGMYNWV